MSPLWDTGTGKPEALPDELRELIDGGWRIGPAGALVLARCYGDGSGWGDDWRAEEIAGHEFEVNDVGIPCDDFPEERDLFLRAAVARARAFVGAAVRVSHGLTASELLVAIISVGVDDDYLMHGTTVKFATRRGGFPDFFEDLERFQCEAMAVLT